MSRRSSRATPTFVSELKVLSTTPPVLRFLILVRTTACPLPGLWCWNSMTSKSPSGRWTTMPRRRSLVFVCSAIRSSRESRQVLIPDLGHDEEILDAHAADAGQVHTGLDRDEHSRFEHRVRSRCERGALVYVEADTVSRGMHEVVGVAVGFERLPRGGVDVGARDTGLHGFAARFERADDRVVHLSNLVGRVRPDPRTRRVRAVALEL